MVTGKNPTALVAGSVSVKTAEKPTIAYAHREMNIKTADKSLLHLYPPFRVKLEQVLKECEKSLGIPWTLAEGYRSTNRQLWLYSSGRTREGPVVTWKRSPTYHGTGLAADCIPKRYGYDAPRMWWELYRKLGKSVGLDNPAWENGDLCHLQWSEPTVRARALTWVRGGFKDPPPDPPAAGAISVLVDGQPVPDADAYLLEGKAWVKLRPVTDGLDLVIAEVSGKGSSRVAHLVDDTDEWLVAVTLKAGRAYVRATDLPAGIYWVGGEKLLSITPRRRD